VARRKKKDTDELIRHVASEFEPEDVLQRNAAGAEAIVRIFGVSGQKVAAAGGGVARRGEIERAGFRVHETPIFGAGHVTIELPDPVTPADAVRFNALFGRSTAT
jgi:hypothetical protein